MSNANWASGGKLYSPFVKPVLLNCNFVVDSANGNGLGIRSLKGPYVDNAFMHTSVTPGTNLGYTNPNPASGNILIQTADNFQRYLGGFAGFVAPVSGSALTSVTQYLTYIITSVGTTTLAQWQAKGLPVGITPAVGAAFVATATGSLGGSGTVKVPNAAGSGIDHIEVIGDANTTLGGVTPAGATGAFMILQCFKNGVLTAPTDGTVISLTFWFNDSSVQVAGE